MSEQRAEDVGDVKQEVQPEQSKGVRFTETMADAKAKIDAEKVSETAESLGVDQASYDKYYRNGQFDWASYGKEQAFKAKQSAKKAANPDVKSDEQPAKSEETKGEEPAKEAAKGPTEEQQEEAKKAVESAGLDWNDLGQQILDNGDISKDDREALNKMGVPDEIVNRYIEMLQSDVDAVINKSVEGFGGEEMFTKVFDGLQKNATVEQRENIDALLMDPSTFDEGIALGFKLSGVEPPSKEAPAPAGSTKQPFQTPNASTGASGGVEGFKSFEEQVAAMRDPRYKNDPAYRAQVMERVRAGTYDINPRTHTSGL